MSPDNPNYLLGCLSAIMNASILIAAILAVSALILLNMQKEKISKALFYIFKVILWLCLLGSLRDLVYVWYRTFINK